MTAVRDFGGTETQAEPLVGEIVGLRTFRVEESGLLVPLFSEGAWYNGANTAVCSPPTGDRHATAHAVPDEACECGFYAYGSQAAAAHNRQARYVQAVVSCWGGVVAGTQGVRAEHARIDAIWLHPAAPRAVRVRVAARYPSARLYADVDAMLGEHPLSELPCYAPPRPRRPVHTALAVVAAALLLVLGLLPYDLLASTDGVRELWLAATVGVGALTVWLVVGTHGVGHRAAAFVTAGVLGWLLAPLFGVAGWLLRVPLLRGLAVAAGGYVIALRPRYFPLVREQRQRAFCGVRP